MTDWLKNGYFAESIKDSDTEVYEALRYELTRQRDEIELIASENIVSKAVLEAQGSIFTNKYAEGYSGKRYYGGCAYADMVEDLAVERAKKLFNCQYVNVQPHSGSQANQAVMFALLNPGDTILGMSLSSGGHLTHGATPNQSGKWFNAIGYGVNKTDSLIDFNQVEDLAKEYKPRLIIAGGSAYSRIIDFQKFREIADRYGAMLLVDMAHIAGLVASGVHPNPLPYADVVTTTTHKTLRGARGGMILTNHKKIAKKINSSIFPGIQGGPLMHIVAAKAVAFGEALLPSFKQYGEQTVKNAKALAKGLINKGFDIVSGGTDTHIVLVDLRPKSLKGLASETSLCNAHITCNKNTVPYDVEKPTICSGIRLGTSVITTRGFLEDDCLQVADLISETLDGLISNAQTSDNTSVEKQVREKVKNMCAKFPIYPDM